MSKKKPASTRQIGGSHYRKFKLQPTYFCQVNRLPAIESAVIGYLVRHREKGGASDIEKGIHLLQLLLEWEYPKQRARKRVRHRR